MISVKAEGLLSTPGSAIRFILSRPTAQDDDTAHRLRYA